MMIHPTVALSLVAAAVVGTSAAVADEQVPVRVDGKELIFYQAKPISNPKGGDKFHGSNFIHPLKTPSGFVVTESQPADHLHHFGLWWPWKNIEIDGRTVLCWELQTGDGLIQAKESTPTENGLVAISEYIDRKAPGGPVTVLLETTTITASDIVSQPAQGYFLELNIVHRTAVDRPITVTPYRYSGFSLRGPPSWVRKNSTVLTSDGEDRDSSNFTHARWVRVQGDAGGGNTAGILMMSRPDNQAHPEKLRTWDSSQHDGAVFINFNTVADEPWRFEPGTSYPRNYRLFVYDGEISVAEAEALWEAYAASVGDGGS